MKLVDSNITSRPVNIDLIIYVKIIGRYWVAITLWVLLVTLATTLMILLITPMYRASATLLIESQSHQAVSIEEVYSLDTSKKEYYQTQFEILRSDHIAEKVIEQLELANHPEFTRRVGKLSTRDTLLTFLHKIELLTPFFPNPLAPSVSIHSDAAKQAILKTFKSQLTIEPIRNTQLVNIHFDSVTAQLAAQVVNALGNVYITSNLEARLLVTQTASSWIGERLIELKNNLNETELSLIHFLKKENLIELDDINELAGTELTNISVRLSQARDKRVAAESLFSLLQNNWEGGSTLLSVPEISNHPQVRDVKNAEIDAERKVSELAKRYGPKHDKMIQALAQLDAVQNRTELVINNLARGIKKELDSTKQQERSLIREFEKKKQDYQKIISKRAKYDSLKRDVESNRQLYDLFLNRQKETSVSSDSEALNARFTDIAATPQHPFYPQTTKLIVISAAFAFLFAVVCAFLADAYRNTIENPDDIEEKLKLHHLGYLPKISVKRFKNTPIDHTLYFDSSALFFSDSVKNIRTAILLSLTNSHRKTLAITSSLPSEGKTTVALSLAQSLAKMEKTLLIDCDLRMPSIGQRYGLPTNQSGLTNVLMTESLLEDNIYHDAISSLDILPAGLIPANPQELLSSAKFSLVLSQLQQIYDRIIIDTPPILVVSDGLIVGDLVNGMILVIKAETTTEKQINQSIKQLARHHIPIDGVVLNQLSSKYSQEKYQLLKGYYQHNRQHPETQEAS